MMRLWWLVLMVPLAGCMAGGSPDTVTEAEPLQKSEAEAEDRYVYSLFLGITATEGPLDWTLYEEALSQGRGPAKAIAETFDQDVPYGDFGDGKVGSWLTTHFVYDEERRLVGGLYTQILADGTRNAILAPFTGPYAGTMALPHLEMFGPSDLAGLDLQEPEGPVLCALRTWTDDKNITSAQAAKIALDAPGMQDHLASFPEGELTYHYFPSVGVEEDCPIEMEPTGNHWTVYHTDLDAYLAGNKTPSLASVRIDAATGDVLHVEFAPLVVVAPTIIDHTMQITDPLVPETRPARHTFTIPVEEGATELQLSGYRRERPGHMLSDHARLVDPEGRPVASDGFDQELHTFRVRGPQAGDWTYEYAYQSLRPQGEHRVELHGIITYT